MFHFKKFSIDDSRAAMKVGTDAVLLGAWVRCKNETRILDIGTGSGILALMMAQRNNGIPVDAVEIENNAADIARQNFRISTWSEQITIYNKSISEFMSLTNYSYSLIVCNPPFFSNSLKTPLEARNLARHNDSLPVTELLGISSRLLTENGKAAFIIPFDAYDYWHTEAGQHNLLTESVTIVKSSAAHKPHRVLVLFTKQKVSEITQSELILYSAEKTYSFDYQQLTRDFYLKF